MLFLVINPFKNDNPCAVETNQDKKICLGSSNSAVSAGHRKFEGEQEPNRKTCLCVCQISAWFHCSLCGSAPSSSCGGCAQTYWFPLFCVLLWMKTGGDSEQGDETLLSAQRHGSAAPVAPLLSTLPLDSTGDSLQCTFYEPFSRFSALVLLLSCNMRESCFSFFVISFPGMTTVWYGHFVYNLIVIFHFVHKKILCWCISVMPSVWCPCVWSLLG